MAQITTLDLAEARQRLKHRTAGYEGRAALRQAIANMSETQMLELEREEGESLRKLRLNVNRAAKEANRQVDYGASDEGTLLVWLLDKPKKKRGPRRKQPK